MNLSLNEKVPVHFPALFYTRANLNRYLGLEEAILG